MSKLSTNHDQGLHCHKENLISKFTPGITFIHVLNQHQILIKVGLKSRVRRYLPFFQMSNKG